MSAWSMSRGGPLPDTEIDAVVALLRSWQVAPAALVDAEAVTGDPARGASLYAAACAKCHGRPEAPEKGPRLWTPELLAAASDGFLRVTIAEGRPGTTMPSFAGQLAEDEIRHVVSYLRSLARPPHELTPIPPRPGQLADVVVNPAGPDAALPSPVPFVPVEEVARELARGAAFVLLDARPPSDYVREHIAGAVSAPFYEVEAYAPQLPKERYVVTYCGCPHAESGVARDALLRLGFPRVAVLDEGVSVWRERGYLMRAGALP